MTTKEDWIATLEASISEAYTILKPIVENASHVSSSPILRAYKVLSEVGKSYEPEEDD